MRCMVLPARRSPAALPLGTNKPSPKNSGFSQVVFAFAKVVNCSERWDPAHALYLHQCALPKLVSKHRKGLEICGVLVLLSKAINTFKSSSDWEAAVGLLHMC